MNRAKVLAEIAADQIEAAGNSPTLNQIIKGHPFVTTMIGGELHAALHHGKGVASGSFVEFPAVLWTFEPVVHYPVLS